MDTNAPRSITEPTCAASALSAGLERMFRVIASDHPTNAKRWTTLELAWINERITLAILAEREACADIADRQIQEEGSYYGKECAELIRNLVLMRSNV